MTLLHLEYGETCTLGFRSPGGRPPVSPCDTTEDKSDGAGTSPDHLSEIDSLLGGAFERLNMSESSWTLGSGVSVKDLVVDGRLGIGASDTI